MRLLAQLLPIVALRLATRFFGCNFCQIAAPAAASADLGLVVQHVLARTTHA